MQYALVIGTDETISIDKAARGLKCNCYCKECNGNLEAVKGEINRWHFRHAVKNSGCGGGRETVLHQRAKEIIVNSSMLLSAKHSEINYINAIAEKELMSIRPDVTAENNGAKILFEIAVTHLMEVGKHNHLREKKLRCIEIDLSDWLEVEPNEKELEFDVLFNPNNRVDLFWDQQVVLPLDNYKPSFLENPLSYIFMGLAAWGLLKWLKQTTAQSSKRKNDKRNRKKL